MKRFPLLVAVALATIIGVARDMGAPPRAWLIGLPISKVIMVAMASAVSRSAPARAESKRERSCSGLRFHLPKP